MASPLALLQHENMIKLQQLEELERMSQLLHASQSELRFQESLLDFVVAIWQKKFICNAFVDGICRETVGTCDKIHLVMSHEALKAELREAQKHKSMLASPQFAIIWTHAHQMNFRCLNLLNNIVMHTGKYLWDESEPVYPDWALNTHK
jgi:hypothetical protein